MGTWEQNVRTVEPYVPGEQPKIKNIIKLNTNENPYPPAPGVRKALREVSEDALRKYPDPKAEVLVTAIAEYYHLKEQQVFVGVGSDDVLAMAFMTFFNSSKPILFPDITYSFYDVWANVFRIPYQCRRLNEQFCICTEDYCGGGNGGIVIPNPNAPTGVLLETDQIEKIVSSNPDCVVIIDEAYIDFGGQTCLPLIERYDNLLVVQTFSKSRSLAGMRIGFAMGNEKLIRYLNDVKYSFNSYTMNQTSLAAGVASLADEEYFQATRKKIMDTRERVKEELRKLGFCFEDSQANFIFATHPEKSAEKLFEDLRKENLIVRYFRKPRIDQYLRITIGTDEEMDQLLDYLRRNA